MTMLKVPVQFSSNVKEIGHDPATNTGYVKFNSGHDYLINGMTAEAFEEWQKAKSKGGHYNQVIKNHPDYEVVKIGHDKDEELRPNWS